MPRYTFANITQIRRNIMGCLCIEQIEIRQATDEGPCDVKAGCRKSINFKGLGGMDAACGESRQGRRVSPCPLKLMLFREAAGHPVSHKGLHRLPLWTGLSSLIAEVWSSGIVCETLRNKDVAREPTWMYSRRSRKQFPRTAPNRSDYSK